MEQQYRQSTYREKLIEHAAIEDVFEALFGGA